MLLKKNPTHPLYIIAILQEFIKVLPHSRVRNLSYLVSNFYFRSTVQNIQMSYIYIGILCPVIKAVFFFSLLYEFKSHFSIFVPTE